MSQEERVVIFSAMHRANSSTIPTEPLGDIFWENLDQSNIVKLFFNSNGKVATEILLGRNIHYMGLFGTSLQDA